MSVKVKILSVFFIFITSLSYAQPRSEGEASELTRLMDDKLKLTAYQVKAVSKVNRQAYLKMTDIVKDSADTGSLSSQKIRDVNEFMHTAFLDVLTAIQWSAWLDMNKRIKDEQRHENSYHVEK